MEPDRYRLDDFDRKLLKLLQENSRAKNTELAQELNVTEGAIRKRIKKLVESKYIEKFTIKLNEVKLPTTSAIVQIMIGGDMSPENIKDEILGNVNGVDTIYETTGEVDLFCIFNTSGDHALKDAIEKLRSIEGVKSTKTFVALQKTRGKSSSIL
ncbi:MAG: Lrp/AsnC family transcriptional regulator [Candidatus Heimdallarchaeota archaeon]|nr:Lrp/AsnC family transcriptional regulator [Candidatus Heimdallarchaeota archaeon]